MGVLVERRDGRWGERGVEGGTPTPHDGTALRPPAPAPTFLPVGDRWQNGTARLGEVPGGSGHFCRISAAPSPGFGGVDVEYGPNQGEREDEVARGDPVV